VLFSWIDSCRIVVDVALLPKSFRLLTLARRGFPRNLWKPYDARALASTRAHLQTVKRLWDGVQVPYQRRRLRASDGRAWPVVATPLILHDQYTLYAGNLGGNLGASGAAREMPCACGAEERGLSATPPIVVQGVLRRADLPEPVTFCWQCFAF
jgi:hypothetical protein